MGTAVAVPMPGSARQGQPGRHRGRVVAGHHDVAAVFQDPADHFLDHVRHRQRRGAPVRAAGVGLQAQRAAPAAFVPGHQPGGRDDQGRHGAGADRGQAGGQAHSAMAARRQSQDLARQPPGPQVGPPGDDRCGQVPHPARGQRAGVGGEAARDGLPHGGRRAAEQPLDAVSRPPMTSGPGSPPRMIQASCAAMS